MTAEWCKVGDDLLVVADYLDMKDVPVGDGMENSGYLVLHRGESVRVLYIGTASASDAGWLYGEVTRNRLPGRAMEGRRGWLPEVCLKPSKVPESIAGGHDVILPLGNKKLTQKVKKRQVQADKAGVSLPPDKPTGAESLSGGGYPQARQIAPAPRGGGGGGRASAAPEKDASKNKESCPICATVYLSGDAECKAVSRVCCGAKLCAKCDHKNLRDKNCFFCRKKAEVFPSLSVACRVKV